MSRLRLIILAVLCGFIGTVVLVEPAKALSGSSFQAGKIMDDGVFFNGRGMDTGTIQNFLNSKVPSCDTNGTKPYGGSTRAVYGTSQGYPPPYTCLKDYSQATTSLSSEPALCNGFSGGTKTAAQIINEVAISCGINPKVILVLLQKEQSLVTDDWPWSKQYSAATGYACPDTAACDPQYAGFFKQVYYGARQFKRYARDATLFRYRAGRDNYIQYHPNTACGGTNVFIQNQATAGLYNYTPYQPNQAALNNLYGTGDGCSAYGNRNFWRMFIDWFGSTHRNCIFPATSSYGVFRLYNPTTGNHLLTNDPVEVCNASSSGFFYDGRIFTSEASQNLPVYRLERWGRYLYTASRTERDQAVWNYGYRYEGVGFYASSPSTEGAQPLYRLSNGNGYYLYTMSAAERDSIIQQQGYRLDGVPFYINENPGIVVAPVYRLSSTKGPFLFTLSSIERDSATSHYGYTYQGVGFNAITQMNPITVPIYRLAGPKGFLFTRSIKERTAAFKLGFRDEGISMYTYGSQDENLNKIYRLRHPIGSYLYTASEAERENAARYNWFIYEGIGFRTP